MDIDLLVTFVTVPDLKTGNEIAVKLLEKHLAACVNVVPGIISHYWWQGKMESSNEAMLIIKTSKDKFEDLKKFIRQVHPYEVPEIISVPIVMGDAPYLQWIKDSLEIKE